MTSLVPFMSRDFERFLNGFNNVDNFNPRNRLNVNNYRVEKNDDGVKIKFDMPGVPPEDIKVEVHNNVLHIHGERNEVKEVKNDKGEVVSKSTTIANYSNSFELADKFNVDKLDATIEHGVLEVTLPYAEEIAPKTIEVKVKDSGELEKTNNSGETEAADKTEEPSS